MPSSALSHFRLDSGQAPQENVDHLHHCHVLDALWIRCPSIRNASFSGVNDPPLTAVHYPQLTDVIPIYLAIVPLALGIGPSPLLLVVVVPRLVDRL